MRLKIPNLLPDTDYAIQVRAMTDDGPSEWSLRYEFKTISDTGKPRVPTNVSFQGSDRFYHAEWDAVTQNLSGDGIDIKRYEVQLRRTGSGTTTKVISVQDNESLRLEWDLGPDRIRTLFGGFPDSLEFRVRAVAFNDRSSDWSAWVAAEIGAPDAPRNGAVESAVDSMVITWEPPLDTSNVYGYRVYVGATSDFTPSLANRIYEGINPGYTYTTSTYQIHYFKIRCYNEFGVESTDLIVSGEPISPYGPDENPPTIPSGLSVSLTRNGQNASANLTWTFDPSGDNEDIQSFAIKWRKLGTTNYFIDFTDKGARTLSVVLPEAYANYGFSIAAVDFTANYSDWSPEVTLSGDIPGPPPQMTGVTASTGLDSITINWPISSAADVVKYKVDIATNSTFTNGLVSTVTGDTSITFSGLSVGTTYYYRVAAIDATDAQGAYSATANATTKNFPVVELSDGNPPASSPTPIVTGGIGYLSASWSPVTNNDHVTYEVHLSSTSGFTPSASTKVAEISGTVVSLERDGSGAPLTYGTTYYVKIIAKDIDGPAAASAQGSGTLSKVSALDSALTAADVGAATSSDVDTKINTYNTNVITPALNGKNKIIHSTSAPGTTANTAGDTWVQVDDTTNNRIISQWRGTGGTGWVQETIRSEFIAYLDASKISADSTFTNNLNVKSVFTLGDASTTGVIKSYNYHQTNKTGFTLSSAGLEIWQGKVIADALVTGNLASAIITLASGGQIKSSNYDGTNGFSLTENSLIIRTGTVSAGVLESGSTITANLGVTGNMTISSSGTIKSTNYSTTPGSEAGFSLSSAGLDVRSGTIAVGTLLGGTISGQTIRLGVNGKIIVDASGAMQSNNYSPGVSGWYLGPTGLDMPGLNINVGAGDITGGTFNGGNFIVGSGGTIQSSNWNGSQGWQLGYNGLTVHNGSIIGGTISGAQFTSTGGNFSINSSGYASFTGASISGTTIVGSGGIQSSDYVLGSQGWKISSSGGAELNTGTFRGNVSVFNGSAGVTIDSNALTITNSFGATVFSSSGSITMAPTVFISGSSSTTSIYANGIGSFSGGLVTSGTVSGNWLNASGASTGNSSQFTINGGYQLNGGGTINGGPVINGSPTWTAPGTGGSANVNWNAGKMQPITSSRRYKTNIQDFDIDLNKVYQLEPRKYERIGQGEEIGFIAEEALDCGLDEWVTYNEDGEVESFDYYKWVVALQAAARSLHSENLELKEQLQSITARLDAAGI